MEKERYLKQQMQCSTNFKLVTEGKYYVHMNVKYVTRYIRLSIHLTECSEDD
jgi:hypothetical protein